jgi:hypothetical protein
MLDENPAASVGPLPTVISTDSASPSSKNGEQPQIAVAATPSPKACVDPTTAATTITAVATNKTYTITRFLVKQLKGGAGYAKTDFYVDLVESEHGLLTLVKAVFDILQKNNLTGDAYYSHLWSITLHGVCYEHGWRNCRQMKVKNHVDDQDIQVLAQLDNALQKGQKGSFRGESAKFDVVIDNCDLLKKKKLSVEEIANYPKTTAIPSAPGLDATMSDAFVSEEVKEGAQKLRIGWKNHLEGDNEWRRDRESREFEWVIGKPLPRVWDFDEMQILGLLLNSNQKFKKSWTNLLQFAFCDRAETATSQQWYKLRKESYRMEYIGRGLCKDEQVILAKRLCLARLEKMLEAGVPTLGPHPLEIVESRLLKRGVITDATSPESKKRKLECYMYLALDGSDSE